MPAQSTTMHVPLAPSQTRLALEGMVSGIIGATVLAIWFLILDVIQGRPLYTPTVLGTALFGTEQSLSAPGTIVQSLEMTFAFTWIHGLVFIVIGSAASFLIGLAEKNPNLGFGILLLFVVLEFGFIFAALLFAEPVLHVFAWPAVFVGNLLAATAMGVYFWYRHPNLTIRP